MTAHELGRVTALYRYPVKSMAGESLQSATMGWHGLEGDRRLAFLRRGAPGGFPWLTASKLPQLVRWTPQFVDGEAVPSLVRSPDGVVMALRGEEVRTVMSSAHGSEVELVQLDHGIFDDATISMIAEGTFGAICEAAGVAADVRRFRPNIQLDAGEAFCEDRWVGRTIRFGTAADSPSIVVSMHDIRCVMINLDPDTAASDPRLLKAAVTLNQNRGGVYGTVVRTGTIAIGAPVIVED